MPSRHPLVRALGSLFSLGRGRSPAITPINHVQRDSGSSAETSWVTVNEDAFAIAHMFPHICKAIESESVEGLEQCVKVAVHVISDVIQRLHPARHDLYAASRVQSLQELSNQAKAPEFIIGVVGSTGTGKSCLINALLGEVRLVPTNCVRACTAVITEISWNPSDNPKERYIANIEFVSAEDWNYELEKLFQDLVLPDGEVSQEATNKSTDAGVAWAKIHAVYPHITREELPQIDRQTLANDPAVVDILGATRIIRSPAVESFYEGIRVYVDSREKIAVPSTQDGEGSSDSDDHEGECEPAAEDRHMELWPLIKVVKIQTKADVLSTGAVIVDLPGTEDSNAARAAIASRYIQKCHGIWIVANIQRAVDDRAACNLLGRSFKQQLHLDGNLSNITFVCSKTDDICIDEAAESLRLQAPMTRLRDAAESLEQWEASNEEWLSIKKAHLETLGEFLTDVNGYLHQWENLKAPQQDKITRQAPIMNPRKRKTPRHNAPATKRLRIETSTKETDPTHPSVDDLLCRMMEEGPLRTLDEPVTEEQIRSMIEYLRSQQHDLINDIHRLKEQVHEREEDHGELEESYSHAKRELHVSCIRARNVYARKAIQQDYANEMQKIYQSTALCDDSEDDDPEEDQDGLTKILPVFCVSSQSYQSIIKRDDQVPGFEDCEATEIPQLISHAKKSTVDRRTYAYLRFLVDFIQEMYSLHLWSAQDEERIQFACEENINDALVSLSKGTEKAVSGFTKTCRHILIGSLFKRIDMAVTAAGQHAPAIAQGWPSRRPGDGGLRCNTYRAVCSRSGVFASKQGFRDFNEDLIHPLKEMIAWIWDKSFRCKLPSALSKFTKATKESLQEFHNATAESQMQQRGPSSNNTIVLQALLASRSKGLTHMIGSFNEEVNEIQREATRSLHLAVQGSMLSVYRDCAETHGRGCFERMKRCMGQYLEDSCEEIFREAAAPMKRKLEQLCGHLEISLGIKVSKMICRVAEDYRNALTRRDIMDNSNETQAVRDEISIFLGSIDGHFEHTLRVGVETPPLGTSTAGEPIIKSEPDQESV